MNVKSKDLLNRSLEYLLQSLSAKQGILIVVSAIYPISSSGHASDINCHGELRDDTRGIREFQFLDFLLLNIEVSKPDW